MIVTITKGRSLGGLGLYLLHDKAEPGEPHATTSERVAWTHTHNLSEDDPEEALREMIATAQAQPALRAASGQSAAGRKTRDSTLHVALSWEPSERPTRAEMIEAAESYLRANGWHAEYQVLMVCHNDTAHAQLHLAISRINPTTGATINDRWHKNDAQRWAKQYQDARGQDFTPERTKRAEGKAYKNLHMPRRQYEQWKKTGLTREAFLAQAEARDARDQQRRGDLWEAQKAERKQFFRDTGAGAKGLRAAVWVAVKEEFAPRWASYARLRERADVERRGYSQALKLKLRAAGYRDWAPQLRRAERQRAAELRDELAAMRAGIQADQSARFEQVNEAAWMRFQQERGEVYRGVLARQQTERQQARAGQAVPPPAPTTVDQLVATRARAVADAMQMSPPVAHGEKPAFNATLPPAPDRAWDKPTIVAQGKKPMQDEDEKRKKARAPAELVTPPPPPRPVPITRSADAEAKASEQAQRTYEADSRAAAAQHAKQFGAGEHYVDPNASIKEQNRQWEAERREEQRAREAGSQPYESRAARQEAADARAGRQATHGHAPAPPPEAPAFYSTEHRPPGWHGGTPQHGFGFTPPTPPNQYGQSQPGTRDHAAPRMERYPLGAPLQSDQPLENDLIRGREALRTWNVEARAREEVAERAQQDARTAFSDGRARVTGLTPDRADAIRAKIAARTSADVARKDFAAEKTIATPGREPDPRRSADATRYSAGKEVTDRMAERAGRQGETSDRSRVVTDREALRQSLNAHAKAEAANRARDRDGRDR